MKSLILALLASTTVTVSNAQSTFNKTYTSANGNAANDICTTAGQGMLLTGFSRNPNNKDLLVVRTNNNGDTLWSRIYDTGGSDEGYGVKEAADGSIIIGGKKGFTRLDANGNVIWAFTGNFTINAVEQTPDGRFVFAGDSAGVGMLWTVYQNNATNWLTTFHYGSMISFNSVQLTFDGGFILLGTANTGGMVAVKLDGGSSVQWSKVYTLPVSQPGSEAGTSIVQTADSGYVFTGSFIHNTLGGKRLFLGKTDKTGAMQWANCYGDLNRNVTPKRVELTPDSGLIVFGTIDTALYDSRAWVMRTDAAGDTLWTREYGAGQNIQLTGGVQLAAGGFALACRKVNAEESYFIKTDSNGISGCFESHFPLSVLSVTPTTQLPTGSVLLFSGMPCNSTNNTITLGLTENVLCYSVGITEFPDNLSFAVFPNPSPGDPTLHYHAKQASHLTLTVWSTLGQVVHTSVLDVVAGENTIALHTELEEGIYFLVLEDRGVRSTKKLVISKR
jgi:hypothetical protein